MKKLKSLNLYQKIIMLIITAMPIVFAAVYFATLSRVGFEYEDKILVPTQQNGATIYSGKISGKKAEFTVTADKAVEFRHGDKVYGPYTAKEDPTAIPNDEERADKMTGVELRCGDEIIFRGGAYRFGEYILLINENGESANMEIFYSSGYEEMYDMNGNIVDPIEPSPTTILNLMAGPKLTNKGEALGWFGGTMFCIIVLINVLYADELFRWGLSFRIRNAERAEPSEWEIAGRYIGCTLITVMALAIFVVGIM